MFDNIYNLELIIKIGGVHLLICAVFHLFFPRMYHWEKVLKVFQKKIISGF